MACGKYVSVCPIGTLQIAGKLMGIDEVLDVVIKVVIKDEAFYRNSG